MTSQTGPARLVSVFDPPLCCSSGVCGPSVDPALTAAAADLAWLESVGVRVERFNLAQQPDAFATNPAVLGLLREQGQGALPAVVVDGRVVAQGRYPSRDELAQAAGLAAAVTPMVTDDPASGGGCTPGGGCC